MRGGHLVAQHVDCGESTELLSTVFAEEPLARERLQVLRLVYRFRFRSSKQRAKSLGKRQGMDRSGAWVFWKIKASSVNDANQGKPAASHLLPFSARLRFSRRNRS